MKEVYQMTRSLLIVTLCVTLLAPALLVAESPDAGPAAKSSLVALASPAAAPQDQQPTTVRPNTAPPRQSYQQEAHPRRHSHHISKGEIIFMAGIAGTSMGIGALAGGGTGLAIGAIVGGWGAFAGHKIWHWVNR
jgi:CHASE1-domain containing sensor protein